MRTWAGAALVVALMAGSAWATDPVSPISPIPVTEADQLAWERYFYMEQLSAAQVEILQLRNAATLRDEKARLDVRFKARYNLTADQIQRTPNGTFTPKANPSPAETK